MQSAQNLTIRLISFLILALPATGSAANIPFFTKTDGSQTKTNYGAGSLFSPGPDRVVEIPSTEITKIVQNIRKEVCAALVDGGDITVWLKGEASGKFVGIGASAESGIEVKIRCQAQSSQPQFN